VALSRTSSSRCRYQPLQCYGYMVDTPSGILCHSSSNCYQICPPTRSTFHSQKSRSILASRLGSEAVSSSGQHGSTFSRGPLNKTASSAATRNCLDRRKSKHISALRLKMEEIFGMEVLNLLCASLSYLLHDHKLFRLFFSASTCQLGHY
jgi:hypothetical protein